MSNKQPLVCRFGALGDMVMITPLLKRLYERSGLPVDLVVIGDLTKALFKNMPYVDTIYSITSRKTPYIFNRPQRQLVKTLKQQAYENAWICESNKKSIALFKRAGITRDNAIFASRSPLADNEHFVDHWMKLADISPANCSYQNLAERQASNTMLFVTDDEVTECKNWLESRCIDSASPLICIQAGNKRTTRAGNRQRASNIKYWPEADWAAVIDRTLEHIPTAQILLCGSPAEQSLTIEIQSLCKDKGQIFSVADDLPLRRLMALLSISHSCISVDTGPAHIAAALNCPLTVLFGKTNPNIYSPKSSESKVIVVTGRNHDIELTQDAASWANAHDMSLITVNAVFEAWQRCYAR